jgi:glutamine synthetase adenylyltransferase
MKIAQITNGQVSRVDNRENFGVFSNPPLPDQLVEHSAYVVQSFIAHDSATQKLVPSDPHFDGTSVFDVSVVSKDVFDIAADKASAMAQLRTLRDQRLSVSDFSQTADVIEINGATKTAAWKTYRQALRDLPEQVADARGFNSWPATP